MLHCYTIRVLEALFAYFYLHLCHVDLGALFVVLAAVFRPIKLLDKNFNGGVGHLIISVEHV